MYIQSPEMVWTGHWNTAYYKDINFEMLLLLLNSRLGDEKRKTIENQSKRIALSGEMREIYHEGINNIRVVMARVPVFKRIKWIILRLIGTVSI